MTPKLHSKITAVYTLQELPDVTLDVLPFLKHVFVKSYATFMISIHPCNSQH